MQPQPFVLTPTDAGTQVFYGALAIFAFAAVWGSLVAAMTPPPWLVGATFPLLSLLA